MTTPLLKTKFFIPLLSPNLVPRQRLIERLDRGMAGKLTLVSAPAGFGKTTLLSEFVHRCGRPVAWIALDSADNDWNRFLHDFIAGLQIIQAGLGEGALGAQGSSQPSNNETLLTGLVNELAEIEQPFVIVLDDYHLISEPDIQDTLTFIIENQPVQMHLVVSSRTDPPWPLARWRVRREIAEIRTQDMRFTPEEAAQFLNGVMGLALSPEDITTLETRTEGWIAGLQMAALSMQGRQDVSGFIRSFSGSHRFIFDYLIEEVLDRLSPEIQDFLLKTSILERLCAPLCDTLTVEKDSRDILDQLDHRNLFVIPLDDQRSWYRYHPLFADLLRSRLNQLHPGDVPRLHREASLWYEENGVLDEAMRHAMSVGDDLLAAELIERHSLSLAYHGDLSTVEGWLNRLPPEMVKARPWLCLARAWVAGFSGKLDAGQGWVQAAAEALTDLPDEGQLAGGRMAGHLAMAGAYLAAMRQEMQTATQMARQAVKTLPEEDRLARALATMLLAIALRTTWDVEAAEQTFDEALALSKRAGDIHLMVDVLWERSLLETMQGRLTRVMASCQEAMALAAQVAQQSGRRLPVTGYIYERMSAVHLEQHDLEAARRYAQESVNLSRQWGQSDALLTADFILARALIAAGEGEGALEILRDMEEMARDLGGWYLLSVKVLEARIRTLWGERISSEEWARHSGVNYDQQPSALDASAYLVYARALFMESRWEQAAQLLARLVEMARAERVVYLEMEVYILQALLYQAKGDEKQALRALESAILLAEPEGYVHVFVREGARMAALLQKARGRGLAQAFVERLLAFLEEETRDQGPATKAPPGLVEPLTERELEVLRLLASTLTVPEIAQRLFISIATARSHVKHIYSKLDVHSRFEAVTRGNELGLL